MLTSSLVAGLLGLLGSAVAPPRVVTVHAYDFRFEAPATIPAGTLTFRLMNHGKEIHHLWIVQLTDGRTPADFNKAMQRWGSALKMPAWAVDVGGSNSAGPGSQADGTMTLTPGTYMLVCWIPSPDGMLHAMKGMSKSLIVAERGATPPAEPAADVTMTLFDYGFELSGPIAAGRRTIRVENRATQSHEAALASLHPGTTLSQAMIWMNEGQHGNAPVTLLGGASGLATGRRMYFTADFEPGKYVLLCFIPDVNDGKPHSAHGMAREIEVSAVKNPM